MCLGLLASCSYVCPLLTTQVTTQRLAFDPGVRHLHPTLECPGSQLWTLMPASCHHRPWGMQVIAPGSLSPTWETWLDLQDPGCGPGSAPAVVKVWIVKW